MCVKALNYLGLIIIIKRLYAITQPSDCNAYIQIKNTKCKTQLN